MADISSITLPSGDSFNFKDADARSRISDLESYTDYLGVTTMELEDGVTTSPDVTINSETVTAVKGNIVNYSSKEFIYNGTVWQEFGDMSAIGSLGYKDTASTSYQPAGEISDTTASATTSDATVNSITDVGSLPTMSVSGETLVFDAGTLPTKGSDTTVLTGISSIAVSAPTFTGTSATITVS